MLYKNNTQEKPNNIFIKVCPDIMFANSLIDKLNNLELYDIISIKPREIPIANGTPDGRKLEKKRNPFL